MDEEQNTIVETINETKPVKLEIDYAKLIQDTEAKTKLEIEKAKTEAINSSKNNIDKDVMAELLKQQQAMMNEVLLKQQQEFENKLQDIKKQMTMPKSIAQSNNPNDTAVMTPQEQAAMNWNKMTPQQRAEYIFDNPKKLKVQYDVHPYG